MKLVLIGEADQYIPPMPPPGPAGAAGLSSFFSTINASVVSSRLPIDAALWSAVRVTIKHLANPPTCCRAGDDPDNGDPLASKKQPQGGVSARLLPAPTDR